MALFRSEFRVRLLRAGYPYEASMGGYEYLDSIGSDPKWDQLESEAVAQLMGWFAFQLGAPRPNESDVKRDSSH